jgi:FdhD protein
MTRHHEMIERDGVLDAVAVEAPLEIRVGGEAVAVTMRTPGHDDELALGFLYGERLIDRAWDVGLSADLAANTVDVKGTLCRSVERRRFYTSSSCGVCGKGAIEEVTVDVQPLPPGPVIARQVLADLPDRLSQPGFELTGGLHATGLFSADGALRLVREDVGRHNAMDKVIGHALSAGLLPLHEHALCVSGRLAFELVQKAAVAGAPILVGVGAPTSLAVQLAEEVGMTLCGFAREGRLNVYAGADRAA